MYQHTPKGYKFVEYDDDEPVQRSHCKACEGELSKNMQPSEVTEDQYVKLRPVESNNEDYPGIYHVPDVATSEEIAANDYDWIEYGMPYYDCPHCQYRHDLNEMYGF